MSFWIRNTLGAFADAAILFPLLATLSMKGGMHAGVLLGSAGVAYLASALLFRVPISVQPLKAIAIAALAVGATTHEIRVSGALIGLFCVLLTLLDVNRLASKVPLSLIHGLQLGLGIILVLQGLKFVGDSSFSILFIQLALVLSLLFLPRFFNFPFLGLVATCGLFFGFFNGILNSKNGLPYDGLTSQDSQIRWMVLCTLVFPQMALTLANSVLATRNVAVQYFGEQANKVTIDKLLKSIGIGNLIMSLVGGLPFCHGSGGVTAHVRGGSTSFVSNIIIGVFLMIFALLQFLNGWAVLEIPAFYLAVLLMTTGFFHMGLAHDSWRTNSGKLKLIGMGCIALLTQNMIAVLLGGVVFEWLEIVFVFEKKEVAG